MKQKNIKWVSFNLQKNQIFFYEKYIHKYKYKTKYNILFSFLYKNMNDSKWYKYLPDPLIIKYEKNIRFNSYKINIIYYINKWGKISLTITDNIRKPHFFTQYFDKYRFKVTDFRIIIINYIRLLCFNNDIY